MNRDAYTTAVPPRRSTIRWGSPLRARVAVLLLVLLTPLAGASAAGANDISQFTTVFGTKVAYAGFGGMRGNGTGSLTVSGVSGTVTHAFLYWHGPTNSADPNANATVGFNGHSITGTNIGFSSDNNWGFENSQAYRADVTSLVTGNGTYSLSNFTKTDSSGTVADVNGASLIVFYDDGNTATNRDVVVFEGNDSNMHPGSNTLTFDVRGE